jgi:hypothetical protein
MKKGQSKMTGQQVAVGNVVLEVDSADVTVGQCSFEADNAER